MRTWMYFRYVPKKANIEKATPLLYAKTKDIQLPSTPAP